MLGKTLGWLIVISYLLAGMNYIMKLINRKCYRQVNRNPVMKKIFNRLMKIIVRNHRLFGFSAVTLILFHFVIQFTNYGLSKKGLLAASLIIFQNVLGVYRVRVKKRYKPVWLFSHKIMALIILFAILRHIL